jgi:hypothetical protein
MNGIYKLVKNALPAERCAELSKEFLDNALYGFDPRPGYGHYPLIKPGEHFGMFTDYPDIRGVADLAYNHFLETYPMTYNTFELKRGFGNVMLEGAENQQHDDDGDVYDGREEIEEHYSCILMLNSDYEGGELFFTHHGIELKLEAGDLIMFRGNAANLHGVRTITSGYRSNIILFFKNYHAEQNS